MSAELKLAREVTDFVVAGSWFQSLMVLGKKEWRWESTAEWGTW